MIETDIVIIDSGVCPSYSNSKDTKINGIRLHKENGRFFVDEKTNDEFGHGTAIFDIISKQTSSNIFVIKIFDDGGLIDEELLIYALWYIYENISCKIINLSMGLKVCENLEKLQSVCEMLVKRNTIIVSAFDNEGCNSFPAALDCVIGVDSSYRCLDTSHFEYIESSPINIRAKGGLQRVVWSKNKNTVLGGTSFACAYVTSIIFNIIIQNKYFDLDIVKNELKKKAKTIYYRPKDYCNNYKLFEIKKAALFPFNKEMHSLLRFSEKLKFEIKDIYDIKQSGRVGVKLGKLINNLNNDYRIQTVKDVLDLNVEDIDTIILGHLDEINKMLKKDIRKELVLMLTKKGINVFSFDPLDYIADSGEIPSQQIYFPKIDSSNIPINTFGKMFVISKPVLAIFGTSSKQGKFSLQLVLKEMFESSGYTVGTIGTEPHSQLFGFDYVYPMGYNSTVAIDGHGAILTLNSMINNICEKSEIILVSSQSNSISNNNLNAMSFPVRQHSFLLGVQPDAIILCVNLFDDLEYIKNTIKYLEGCSNSKVIALATLPFEPVGDWRGYFDIRTAMDNEKIQNAKNCIEEYIKLPLFLITEKNDLNNLFDLIIEFF